jgi:hypothetical protein
LSPKLCDLVLSLDNPVAGATLILNTASENAFYCVLYAKILKSLVDADIQAEVKRQAVLHVQAALDSQSSKPFTIFLASAATVGLLPKEFVESFAAQLHDLMEELAADPAAKDRMDGWAEHAVELAAWVPHERIRAMTEKSPNDFPGITYKTLFKFMDLHEKNTQKKIAWK